MPGVASLPRRRLSAGARGVILTAIALSSGLLSVPAAAAAARGPSDPYLAAPVKVSRLPYPFGQDPSWTRGGDILSAQLDSGGIRQIYRSAADGHRQVCLTCRTVKGPNGLPQERPQGDWVLFESFGQQPTHLGGPGLGGFGGDLYVVRRDGTHPFRLTTDSDPDGGARFSASSGTPYDNFHAYFSPTGQQLIWTHTEAAPLSQGGERWEMLLGDFVVSHGRPALKRVRVVGRPYGAYETQPWSPDGRGFLFFAAGGYRSPYQETPPGWGNARVYYMRLYGRGASPEHPRVTLVGDNAPLYQEQAVFAPDMRSVIMMSNRGATLGSWYDTVAAAAQRTAFDAPDTGSTQTLQFLADFNGSDFSSDLFLVDGATGAIRRLTRLRRVIPEFYWDREGSRLLWGLGGAGGTPAYTLRFLGLRRGDRLPPRRIPGWLFGQPVRMDRVPQQAQTIRAPGPSDNRSIAVSPPEHPAAAFPHAARSRDRGGIPLVLVSYLGRWERDLGDLGTAAGATFGKDPAARLGLG